MEKSTLALYQPQRGWGKNSAFTLRSNPTDPHGGHADPKKATRVRGDARPPERRPALGPNPPSLKGAVAVITNNTVVIYSEALPYNLAYTGEKKPPCGTNPPLWAVGSTAGVTAARFHCPPRHQPSVKQGTQGIKAHSDARLRPSESRKKAPKQSKFP